MAFAESLRIFTANIVQNMSVNNDILFKIRSEVEWMVNQLENSNEGEKVIPENFTDLYNKIKDMIDTAKKTAYNRR